MSRSRIKPLSQNKAMPFFSGIINKKTIPYFLLAPAFLYYAVFWLTPILVSIKEVFTDIDGNFSLIGNFKLMFQAENFSAAVVNTAVFALISVLLQYIVALILAILLNRKVRGVKALMFMIMIPMAITPTAVAILWKTGLISSGWINSMLMAFNLIQEPLTFLSARGMSAVLLIVLIDTWTVMPSVMIILVAGLQNLDKEMKEVAFTFGANKYQVLRDITIPLLKPSIITSVVLRMIAAIQVWAIAVMVMGHSNVPFLVERVAYYVDVVYGVPGADKLAYTYSFLTAVIVFAATMVYFKISKRGTAFDKETQK